MEHPTTHALEEVRLSNPLLVDKESITNFSFPKKEVLTNVHDMQQRRRGLELATKAGNFHKIKYRIIFEDNEAVKEVYTTVWATTEKNIVLKQGVTIPIRRIHKVSIY